MQHTINILFGAGVLTWSYGVYKTAKWWWLSRLWGGFTFWCAKRPSTLCLRNLLFQVEPLEDFVLFCLQSIRCFTSIVKGLSSHRRQQEGMQHQESIRRQWNPACYWNNTSARAREYASTNRKWTLKITDHCMQVHENNMDDQASLGTPSKRRKISIPETWPVGVACYTHIRLLNYSNNT